MFKLDLDLDLDLVDEKYDVCRQCTFVHTRFYLFFKFFFIYFLDLDKVSWEIPRAIDWVFIGFLLGFG